MHAFITNFQSPVELEDLIDRYEHGGETNLDRILEPERYAPVEWTVDKYAVPGDRVYFMCAKTSVNHMGHLCAVLRAQDEVDTGLLNFATEKRQLYKEYAGCIVAVGCIATVPEQMDAGWAAPYWRSPWYSGIKDFHILSQPVSIAEFRDFIKVSRTGAITKLDNQQNSQLWDLVVKGNPELESE